MEKIIELIKERKQFVLYVFIGGSAVLVDLITFAVLYNLVNIAAEISNVISVIVATFYSFTLNTLFNFKKKDKLHTRFLLFFGISMVGMLVSTGMLYLFSNVMGIDANIVKVVSLPIILVLQYSFNKKITFK